jgi:hypothetical protein
VAATCHHPPEKNRARSLAGQLTFSQATTVQKFPPNAKDWPTPEAGPARAYPATIPKVCAAFLTGLCCIQNRNVTAGTFSQTKEAPVFWGQSLQQAPDGGCGVFKTCLEPFAPKPGMHCRPKRSCSKAASTVQYNLEGLNQAPDPLPFRRDTTATSAISTQVSRRDYSGTESNPRLFLHRVINVSLAPHSGCGRLGHATSGCPRF